MKNTIMILIALFMSIQAAKADDLFHWCGSKGLTEDCVDWKPVRFNTNVIKVRINPNINHRQEIKQYVISQFNNNMTEVAFLFDGYKTPSNTFKGIYITVDDTYATDAYTKWSKTKDRGAYAEAILVRCNLHPFLNKKFVTEAQLAKILTIAFHETLHAVGLGHDDDINSIMHAGYDPSRTLQQHTIDIVNDLYAPVDIDLAEVQPYVEDGRVVELY